MMMCIANVHWNAQRILRDIKATVILQELVCNIVNLIIMLLIQIDLVLALAQTIILSIELFRLLSIDASHNVPIILL